MLSWPVVGVKEGGGAGVSSTVLIRVLGTYFLVNQFSFEQSELCFSTCSGLIKIVLCDVLKGD